MTTGDDLTQQALGKKAEAWKAGFDHGKEMAERMALLVGFDKDYPDPYLRYLYLLGAGQALANHGRTIGGLDVGKSRYEPTKKGGKA